MIESTATEEAIRLIEDYFDGIWQPQCWADVGCGDGKYSFALTKVLTKGSRVFGIDNDPPDMPVTQMHGVQLRFIKADLVNDNILMPTLDGILLADVLHKSIDPPRMIRKLEKYFHDLGRFMIIEQKVSYPHIQLLFKSLGYRSVKLFRTGNWQVVIAER